MADIDLTPPQEEAAEALDLVAIRPTENGRVLFHEDGNESELVELDADGTVLDDVPPAPEGQEEPSAPAVPPPEEVLGEEDVIDGTASELPETVDSENPSDFLPAELPVDPKDEQSVFKAMDRQDEIAILEELQGRAIATMLYSFEQGGKLLTDLSITGVSETIRLMNERGGCQIGIASQPAPMVNEVHENEEDLYQVMVFARDARHPETGRWGIATEPKVLSRRDGSKVWDKFALTKALNKAERNALKKQIPVEWVEYMKAQFLGGDQVKQLAPIGGGAVAKLPPAIQGEDVDKVRAEIHEEYRKLKALNSLRMAPGKFNGFFTRAETESIERLEAFRDHVRELVEFEEAELAKREQGS